MEQKTFSGKINCRIIEIRFALSGKLANLFKKKGEQVKKGELVGSLDKKLLQTELDKQLADFEKARAEFEIFNIQKGEPQDDITKYLKSQKQASLNVSVKEVELAKARLDQAELFSPVEGIIIDDSNLVPGIHFTPSSNLIKVLDTSSYFFEFEIEQKDLLKFTEPQKTNIKIEGLEKQYQGITMLLPREDGKLKIIVELEETSGLFFGLSGKVELLI